MRLPRCAAPRWLACVWDQALPFLGVLAAVAVFTGMFVVAFTSFDAQREAKAAAGAAARTAALAAQLAEAGHNAAQEARDISTYNRSILERLNPCLPGDPPESDRCLREAQAAARLQGALDAVQAQHDRQDEKLSSLLGR